MNLEDQLKELSPEQQVSLLSRMLARSENARLEAEAMLERRARELDRTNKDLRSREEELRESLDLGNRQLLAAQRAGGIATIFRSRGGKFMLSPEFNNLLGFPEGNEATIEQFRGYIHHLDRGRVEKQEFDFYTSLEPDQDYTYEHRVIRHSDKEVRWLRWTLRRETDADGRFVSVFGTTQDITEQRMAGREARALRLMAERRVRVLSRLTEELQEVSGTAQQALSFLQAVLDAVPQGIAVFDKEQKLAVWNSKLSDLAEINPTRLQEGLTVVEYRKHMKSYHPVSKVKAMVRDESGRIISQSLERRLSDGRTVQVQAIARDDGSLIVSYTDVTQYKEIEEDLRAKGSELTDRVSELTTVSGELRRSNAEAEQANRSKSQFLAMMSHDIRTPMNGVLGMLDTLSRTQLDQNQKNQLELARRSGIQLNTLLNDILEMVRAEAGKIELQPEPVDLQLTLDGIVEFWRAANSNKELEVRSNIDPDLPQDIEIDPTRFRQLVDNLISNALKYTPYGWVRFSAIQSADRLRIEVTDTGPGLTEKQQNRLFEDFSRLRTMTAASGDSSGLGLAICKRLVEAMDGRIGVNTEPGVGSSFWFELPLVYAELDANCQASGEAEDNREAENIGAHVLIVEDVEVNRIVVSTMLEMLGCTFEMAEDGLEALAAIKRNDFDVVLMDVNMPNMDGKQATREIRSMAGPKARLPIIGVTAHVLVEAQSELYSVGMDRLVLKPVSLEELSETITSVLATARAGREAAPPAEPWAATAMTEAPQSSLSPEPEMAAPAVQAEEPVETAVALIDQDALAGLLGALPPSRQAKIIELSLKDLQDLGSDLEEAGEEGDERGIARAAHSLKGVAGNIGAARLHSMLAGSAPLNLEEVIRTVADTVADIRYRFALD